jgi:hypothetical protein
MLITFLINWNSISILLETDYGYGGNHIKKKEQPIMQQMYYNTNNKNKNKNEKVFYIFKYIKYEC